jgi:hypothetical protein
MLPGITFGSSMREKIFGNRLEKGQFITAACEADLPGF